MSVQGSCSLFNFSSRISVTNQVTLYSKWVSICAKKKHAQFPVCVALLKNYLSCIYNEIQRIPSRFTANCRKKVSVKKLVWRISTLTRLKNEYLCSLNVFHIFVDYFFVFKELLKSESRASLVRLLKTTK